MGKPQIPNEKISEIQTLRHKGYSIPEIHRLLKISKSTVLRYCVGIEIAPEFKQRWLNRRNASKIISENAWKIAHQASADLINSLSEKELKILGAALYWAEGAKRNFNFINSDPEMIKLFIHILVKVYRIPVDSIQISIRLFEDISKSEAIVFWSNVTGINLSSDTKLNIIKGSKKGKLPYGMCRIRVKRGGLLLKTLFAINKRVVGVTTSRSSMDQSSSVLSY